MFRSLVFSVLFVFSILSLADRAVAQGEHGGEPKSLDLSRSVDTSKRLTGEVIFKAIEPGVEWPFFKADGKEYKILTCDKTCQEEIKKCKGGEQCEVRAEVREGDSPMIMARTFKVISGAVKTTSPGNAKFTRVTEDELKKLGIDAKKCGEAWKDPSGLIWCDMVKIDMVKKEDGSSFFMNHEKATQYCKDMGAKLPSREDFERLGVYMGATKKDGKYAYGGYKPQVLPNLTYGEYNSSDRWFWSSSVHADYSNYAYVFHGRDGDIYNDSYRHGVFVHNSVRCIVSSR